MIAIDRWLIVATVWRTAEFLLWVRSFMMMSVEVGCLVGQFIGLA